MWRVSVCVSEFLTRSVTNLSKDGTHLLEKFWKWERLSKPSWRIFNLAYLNLNIKKKCAV